MLTHATQYSRHVVAVLPSHTVQHVFGLMTHRKREVVMEGKKGGETLYLARDSAPSTSSFLPGPSRATAPSAALAAGLLKVWCMVLRIGRCAT